MMNLKPDEYLDSETNQVRCKNCQGVRRRELQMGGEVLSIPVLCTCQQEAWEAGEKQRKHREFLDRVQRNRSLGMQDPCWQVQRTGMESTSPPSCSSRLRTPWQFLHRTWLVSGSKYSSGFKFVINCHHPHIDNFCIVHSSYLQAGFCPHDRRISACHSDRFLTQAVLHRSCWVCRFPAASG